MDHWLEIEALAHQSGVAGLLWQRLGRPGLQRLPVESQQRLGAAARTVAVANLGRVATVNALSRRFVALGIPLIVLKGLHIAADVYPDLSMRQMLDIDLLVPRADIDRAIDVCAALGYRTNRPPTRPDDQEARHARPMTKPGAGSVELHWTVASREHAPGLDVDELWAQSTAARFNPAVRVLNPVHLLVHVAMHAAYDHQFNQGVRPVLDLAEIASRHPEPTFWNNVVESAFRWNVARGTGAALWAAREFAGASVPDAIIEQLEPTLTRALQALVTSQVCQPAHVRTTRRTVTALAEHEGFTDRAAYALRRLLPPADRASREYGVPARSLAFARFYSMEVLRRIRRHGLTVLRWQLAGNEELDRFAVDQRQLYHWLMCRSSTRRETRVQRLRRLLGRDGRSTLLAAVAVPVITVSLKLAGLQRTLSWLRRSATAPSGSTPDDATMQHVARAHRRAMRYLPWTGRCLARSLALWWLMQREGIDAQIGLGLNVRETAIDAHAWVISHGRAILDEPRIAEAFDAVFVSDRSLTFSAGPAAAARNVSVGAG